METQNKEQEQLAKLMNEVAGRAKAPKAELVAEVEAHLTDLLGVDFRLAMRSVADRQQIKQVGDAHLDRCHKAGLVLLSHVLFQARIKGGERDAEQQRINE